MSSDEVKGERKLYPLFKDCCKIFLCLSPLSLCASSSALYYEM